VNGTKKILLDKGRANKLYDVGAFDLWKSAT
jgi:hypothetical protein